VARCTDVGVALTPATGSNRRHWTRGVVCGVMIGTEDTRRSTVTLLLRCTQAPANSRFTSGEI